MVENLYIGKNPKSAIELIKKFNTNPNSSSGLLTQPKVISAGESVTVPSGRVTVLPGVRVDGEIVVEAGGEIFIPAGSTVDMGNGLAINGEKVVMSVPTSYHLLQGNLAVDNSVITQGFNTTLYTGNGNTQSINTGIDMDTQWGDTAEEKFGGLVWVKSRSLGGTYNTLVDTVRSAGLRIFTNTTDTQAVADGTAATFLNNGFTLTSGVNGCNANLATYASWNFQTTHRISGVTNHGKPYTCHYNPYTGFTIIKYEGSGIAGHEIPHHLGRKLGFVVVKNLSIIGDWLSQYKETHYTYLNSTAAEGVTSVSITNINDNTAIFGNGNHNNSANQYIMYGWANSYFDKANKLIGNYEVGVYQGTGVAGNKVKTRGKPALVMIKRLDSTGDWIIYDVSRSGSLFTSENRVYANLSNAEETNSDTITGIYDGFIPLNAPINNTSGGQYLYMVAYDTNSDGGGSYYPKATDTSNVQINNALIPIAKGSDINGLKNVMLSKNETITGLTYTAGKNYVYCDANGNYGVKAYQPRYLPSELVRRFAGEQPDYYDIEKNKWFNTDAGTELVTNGTFSDGTTTGWTNNAGHTQIVENRNLKITSTNGAGGQSYQYITTVIGKKYKVRFAVNNVSMYSYGLYIDDVVVKNTNGAFSGTVEHTFTANATTSKIGLVTNPSAAGQVIYFDNISVFPSEITPTSEIPEGRNYLNHIVHADNDGGVLYVEKLPKIEYKDVIKANEYQGKNACTALVNFDGTTTPPTIRDSYNVSKVIRIATGVYDIYFEKEMDNINYSVAGMCTDNSTVNTHVAQISLKRGFIPSTAKAQVSTNFDGNTSALNDMSFVNIQIFGGKD